MNVATLIAVIIFPSFKVAKITKIRPKVAIISDIKILIPSLLFVDNSINSCSKKILANIFFEHEFIELSTKSRDGINIFISEIIATFGLIFVIFATLKDGKIITAISVATFISAGYWFTSSTSFANPAVSIARTFTDSFTGINYQSTPNYIVAEAIGLILAIYIVKKIIR